MLTAVPDQRPALARYGADDLADLFGAFNVSVTYDKPTHTLELAATVTAELVPPPETLRRDAHRTACRTSSGSSL